MGGREYEAEDLFSQADVDEEELSCRPACVVV